MKLNNFEIKNFRSLNAVKFNGLTNINIILGENNCGKTSVLEAIYTALELPTETHYRRILDNVREMSRQDFNFKYLFYQHRYENKISIKINDDLEIKIVPFNSADFDKDVLYKIRLRRRRKDEDEEPTAVVKVYNRGKKIKETIYSTDGYHVDHVDDDDGVNGISYGKSIFLPSKKELQQQSIKGAQYIKENRLENTITEVLQKIDKKIIGWEFGQHNSILIDIEGEQERRNIVYMGDGINKIFAILTTLSYCKDGVLFIDEIENGLHHKTISLLINALHQYVELNPNTQLFVTTHNIDFLNSLNNFIQETEGAENHFSLYTMTKKSDDSIIVFNHDKETLDNYMSTNSELR